MTIGRIMTPNPITVEAQSSVGDAQALMKKEQIHRLPVIDRHKRLVGIVSEKDLLYASPSPASTLSAFEMGALLGKLTVERVMTKKVVTVQEDTLLEDAARLLIDNNIGGVPVLQGDRIVGIVTESDVFRLFIELFGARRKGLRATLLLPDKSGEIAAMTGALAESGANIVSLGTFPGDSPDTALGVIKVDRISKADFEKVVAPFVNEIRDIREV